jgi:phosphatidate cytidylyltransferase
MTRIVTALLLIPFIAWVTLAAPPPVFLAVLAITGLLAYHEFDQIVAAQGIARAGWPGMAAGLALLFSPEPLVAVVLIAMLGLALAMRVNNLAAAMPAAGAFALGIVYIFGAWRCAAELRAMNHHWLLFAMVLSWAGDTLAFYVGRAFGKHKMAPRVSPGKTWEGAAGSVAGAMLVGGIYAHYLIPQVSLAEALALAVAGNVAGQVGDLCESALKRGAGVKDSGTLLPGHGGWLDRLDSSFFSVPAVYALLLVFTRLSGNV